MDLVVDGQKASIILKDHEAVKTVPRPAGNTNARSFQPQRAGNKLRTIR